MIDLSNKYFRTESDEQSNRLLRIAVAQGYHLPKGIAALIGNRIFKFTGFPYKAVSFPENISANEAVIDYADAFGDEDRELKEILDRSTRFCRAHGYSILRIYADENDNEYSGSAFAKTVDGGNIKTETRLPKPRKVTLEEIEQRFGCPIAVSYTHLTLPTIRLV